MMIPNMYVYIYIYLQCNSLVNINQPGKNRLNGAAYCEGKIEVVIVGTWTMACWLPMAAPCPSFEEHRAWLPRCYRRYQWRSVDYTLVRLYRSADWKSRFWKMIQTDSESDSEYIYFWLVVYLPLWKIWKSMGRIIPYIMGKNVWNHQPDFDK